MHKKSSNPVSLFSFQDIITSLTGIMIVIVLVILLQLVESASKITETVQHHSELKLLRETVLQMQKKKELLNMKLLQIRKGNQTVQNELTSLSNAELDHLISAEITGIAPLKSQLAQKKSLLKSVEKRAGERVLQKTSLQNSIEKADSQLEKLKEMARLIAVLKQKKTKFQKAIKRKGKMVKFAFSGFYDRTPVLVEVTSWGFRAKVHPDGKVVSFGKKDEKGSSPEKSMFLLKEWLEKISSSHYVVLLFRKDTLFYHDRICSFLGYKSYGRELLTSQEECF